MTKALRAALALVLTLGFTTAQAQMPPGFTVSASGMFVMAGDWTAAGTDVRGVHFTETAEYENGFGGRLSMGYKLKPKLRGEVEIAYRRREVNEATVTYAGNTPQDTTDFSETLSTLSVMANGIYTFGQGTVRPYVGGGVGLARRSASSDAQTITVTRARGPVRVEIPESSVSDFAFAYQALAGVAIPVNDRVEVLAGYRYFAMRSGDIGDDQYEYKSHTLEVGALFTF